MDRIWGSLDWEELLKAKTIRVIIAARTRHARAITMGFLLREGWMGAEAKIGLSENTICEGVGDMGDKGWGMPVGTEAGVIANKAWGVLLEIGDEVAAEVEKLSKSGC